MTAVSNRLTVLFAGDHTDDAPLIRRALRRINHFVRVVDDPAADPKDCARVCETTLTAAPDLLLLAGAAGLQTLSRWRQQSTFSRLPAVLIGTKFSAADNARLIELNAVGCAPVTDAEGGAVALEEAICQALRLAWNALSQARPEAQEFCVANAFDSEPIRVWT